MKTYSLGAIPFNNPYHTGENICKVLSTILEKTLNASDFKPVITTDSAANMIKGIEKMDGCFWVPCILHCIHNSVKAGLDAIYDEYLFFQKVKGFVKLIGQSPKQAGIFKGCQIAVLNELKSAKKAEQA